LIDLIPTPSGVRDDFRLATDAPMMFHFSLPAVEYEREGLIGQSSPAYFATPAAALDSAA